MEFEFYEDEWQSDDDLDEQYNWFSTTAFEKVGTNISPSTDGLTATSDDWLDTILFIRGL
jgi:hypothetical protein